MVVITNGMSATGIGGVEARDAAEHLTMQRTGSHDKELPDSKYHSAKV